MNVHSSASYSHNEHDQFNKVIDAMKSVFGQFLFTIDVDNPYPGSYGKVQLMYDETTKLNAAFDVFPSGYVYSRINGTILMHDSVNKFEKYLKGQLV